MLEGMALRSVAVIVHEPFALFELAMAYEVFGLDRTDNGVPAFDFKVCSTRPGEGHASQGTDPIQLVARHGLEVAATADLVVVPATNARTYPPELLDTIRDAHARGAVLLSVCSGVFALAAAGVLDGKRAATHWYCAEELRRTHPTITVDADVLYVDEGSIITSAGTAAGIDACLHLVRRELGASVAAAIARRMVVPPHRDGGQQQYVETAMPECNADSLAALLAWVAEHLDREHTTASLARQASMSERTFLRRFAAETGTTPHKWISQQRVIAARHLLETSDLEVDQVAELAGFGSAVVLRDHFRRRVGVSPSTYRRQFAAR